MVFPYFSGFGCRLLSVTELYGAFSVKVQFVNVHADGFKRLISNLLLSAVLATHEDVFTCAVALEDDMA